MLSVGSLKIVLSTIYKVAFDVRMVGIDLLHCFHLGVGRDLAASTIRVLVKDQYWPGSNIDKRLAYATKRLQEYAKLHNKKLVLRRLDKSSLSWSSQECLGLKFRMCLFIVLHACCLWLIVRYPELKCKGYDTAIVCSWLAHELEMRPCGQADLATDAGLILFFNEHFGVGVWGSYAHGAFDVQLR